ncbi:DNA helicase [Staphylococcus phage PG-2021_4]
MKLYNKQKEIVDIIENQILNEKDLKGKMYLSGEMGCGKTYMGAYLANKLSKDYPTIVISPRLNINKWDSLLENAYKIKRKEKYKERPITLLSLENLNMWIQNQNTGLQPFEKDMLVIVDEVHLCDNTKLEGFKMLHRKLTSKSKGIYLTGTIMEGERSKIASIIKTTHPYFSELFNISNEIKRNYPSFIRNVWSYISVAVSLEDIQALSDNREEIKQEMAPITPLPLDKEHELFMEVVESSLRDLDVNPKRVMSLSSSYLDNPSKDLTYKSMKRVSKKDLMTGIYSKLALPLKNIDIKNTSKFKRLLDLINESKDDRILLYVNEHDLILSLQSSLKEEGIESFTLEDVEEVNYSEHINKEFNKYKVGIVNPSKVNVGIDIHAEQLVWYQLMPKIDKMIQAQRRVCRLSSKNKSLVTLFVYDTLNEKARAEELSNATKNNAVTYGVKQEDALAQLTGIILDGIN